MLRKLSILVILVLLSVPAFAQTVDTAWVRRYNGPGNGSDQARGIALDDSGYVYVTGESFGDTTARDYATIKYDQNGNVVWVKRYDGPANGDDYATAITVDDSYYVYVTGYSPGSGSYEDYATIKYKPNGDTVWVRRYNGPGNERDYANAIALDNSGNVYVTGQSPGSGTSYDYATIKYDPDGNQLWVGRYNRLGISDDDAYAIAVDKSGNVYVTGATNVGPSEDYTTIRYYPDGDTAWVRSYNGPGNGFDRAFAIAVKDSDNVYVTGGSVGIGTNEDYTTIKYNSNGDTAWARRYNGLGNDIDEARAIILDTSGNVYVTGMSNGVGTSCDFTTIKYYTNGDTAWVRSYNGPVNGCDLAFAIARDYSGNVYVTGESFGSGANYDYATVKYDSSGNQHWVKTYDGPGNDADGANAIAIDAWNHIYVTGESYESGTSYDYATIKYSPKSRPDTLRFMAYSPVDLIVTDPVLDSIGVNFNTIPGAFYDTTQDLNNDGDRDDRVVIPNPIMGQYMVRVVAESAGTGNYTLAIKLDGNEDRVMKTDAPCPGPGQVDTVVYTVPEYLHGDANRDGKKTVSDVVFLINYLFKGGPAPDPVNLGDVNFCKENPPVQPGLPKVADVVYLVNYLFKGGPPSCS